jgi:hypothetical protein
MSITISLVLACLLVEVLRDRNTRIVDETALTTMIPDKQDDPILFDYYMKI